MKMGIEKTKEVLALGIAVGKLVESLSDGVGLSDIGALVGLVRKVPAGVAAIKSGEIIPELKDLDDAEKAELKNYIKAELDLADDKLEAAIEAGLSVAVDLTDLIKVVA